MATRPRQDWELLRITGLGIFAAVAYGIIHDQITARVCPAYFNEFHPDLGLPAIFHSASPTILGLAWGIVATWWVGLFLGIAMAFSARLGKWPKVSAKQLLRPMLTLLAIMAVLAAIAGVIGFFAASAGHGELYDPKKVGIPLNMQIRFNADLAAHLMSYASGILGGIVLCAVTLRNRIRALPPARA